MLCPTLRMAGPVAAVRVGKRNQRKSAILGSAALAVGLLGPSGAWAQCTDNFNYAVINAPRVGQISPYSVVLPLGTGSALGALTSTINTVNTAFLTTTSAF